MLSPGEDACRVEAVEVFGVELDAIGFNGRERGEVSVFRYLTGELDVCLIAGVVDVYLPVSGGGHTGLLNKRASASRC